MMSREAMDDPMDEMDWQFMDAANGYERDRDVFTRRRLCYRNVLTVLLILCVVGTGIFLLCGALEKIPEEIHVTLHEQEEIRAGFPFQVQIESGELPVFSSTGEKLENSQLHLGSGEPLLLSSAASGQVEVGYKLFGLFKLKSTTYVFDEPRELIPLGSTAGIEVQTRGLLVLGTQKIQDASGASFAPAELAVKEGDYIKELNDVKVSNVSQLKQAIRNAPDSKMVLTLNRDGQLLKVRIQAALDENGERKLGIWIRDSTQGLGTLTYMDERGSFAALGHGVSDVDTGVLMEVEDGTLYQSEILDIKKGEEGEPGQLQGILDRSKEGLLGTIEENTACGIFGQLEPAVIQKVREECVAYPIAYKQEVKIGKAKILCQLDEAVQKNGLVQGEEYEIEIEACDFGKKGEEKNKGMVIRVTDPKLLAQTNGIIQGMSGSPILQDGKLIGAVTHVLVNDPTRGYGIFIENMLEH